MKERDGKRIKEKGTEKKWRERDEKKMKERKGEGKKLNER